MTAKSMTARSILAGAALALVFLAANAVAGGRGGTASVHTQSDGRPVATLNGKSKTCKVGEMPLATGAKTTIVTAKGTKTYPNGLLACLDPKDFGGAAMVTTNNGEVVVKPAPPSGTP